MKRLVGPILGLALGATLVGQVDAGALDIPTWVPVFGNKESSEVARPSRIHTSGVVDLPSGDRTTNNTDKVAVTSIVDGDTLTVAGIGQVRLAQVDAAETGDCYGSEATAALRRLTEGKSVTLRRPPTGPVRDAYDRALADVLVDGKSVNEQLVRDGDAGWFERYASEDVDLGRRLEAAEREAIAQKRGQWSACSSSRRSS